MTLAFSIETSCDETSVAIVDNNGKILRDNTWGTIQQDCHRRDFTVNALYYCPISEKIQDFHAGLKHINKKMICTNPDLIVDRGDNREYCAGSIAKAFEEINGEVIYFGKPYPPVYEIAADINNKKIIGKKLLILSF